MNTWFGAFEVPVDEVQSFTSTTAAITCGSISTNLGMGLGNFSQCSDPPLVSDLLLLLPKTGKHPSQVSTGSWR